MSKTVMLMTSVTEMDMEIDSLHHDREEYIIVTGGVPAYCSSMIDLMCAYYVLRIRKSLLKKQ